MVEFMAYSYLGLVIAVWGIWFILNTAMFWTDGEGTRWVRLRSYSGRYQIDLDAIGFALIALGLGLIALKFLLF